MSIADHPSYTHSRIPDVIARRSSPVVARESETADPDGSTTPKQAGLLTVRPWWDADLAVHGHALADPYVEMFWLGVLGPSTTCLLRRLSRGFVRHPNGFVLSGPDTARAMGLSRGTGRNAPLNRIIDRACTFRLVRRTGPDEIDVRLHVPSLTRRQLSRLPLSVQNAHSEWMSANSEPLSTPMTDSHVLPNQRLPHGSAA